MKTKEKPPIKTKMNNQILPLPKINYSTSNNQNIQKIKSTTKALPNFHNNHNLELFNIVQQNIYKSKEPKKEEQKYNYKTNIKIKNINVQKNIYRNNIKHNEVKTNQCNLKYLLKEFGLSEYLRKLYEIGYDNNNYLKIGTLSRKNFNNLLNNIHIFPGHAVKMENFYEYLKKLNSKNNNYNNNSYNYKKRKLNYNSIYGINNANKNNYNNIHYNNNYENNSIKHSLNINKNKKCLSPRGRPKTSKAFSKPKICIRNNYSGNKLMKRKILNNSEEDNHNILIKSYLNDNKKFIINQKNNNINQNIYNINYNEKDKQKEEYNFLYNSCNNYNNSNNKEIEDKINQNIERMLNYYMVQLNDKLDNSYETVEDSSLSYIVTSQINENLNQNININNKKEIKVLPNYKLPSIKNNNNNPNNNKVERKIENIQKENKLNDKINKKKEKEKTIDEKEIKNNAIKNNEEIKLKEEKKELIEEEIKKEVNKIKEEYQKEIKRFSEETSTKSKDSKEHEIEEDEILLLKDKGKGKDKDKNLINNPINLKDINNGGNNTINSNITNTKNKKESISEDSYLLNEKYSLEQNIYDTLRLNKSLDAENINKDTLKFDIEFMCRCLALALMKHIEQGKEKMHITELYPVSGGEQKFIFNFFNQSFTQNINLLTEFFKDKNNSDSANIHLGDMKMISVLEKYCLENGDKDNDDIDMIKHIKKNGDEKIIEIDDNKQDEIYKFRSGLYDMENEMKFIGELFSYQRKKSKNYQNLSENTKKILCKDLSYIKEIDSEMNKTNTNNSKSNISKSNNNSNINKIENEEDDKENNNIIKEDSKNNNENKTKIIDKGEGEKDDEDYNDYDDEFLNEINIDDNAKKENIDNNKNENEEQKKDIITKDNIINKDDNKEEEKENKKKENIKNDGQLNKKEGKEKTDEIPKNEINENLNINSFINKEESKTKIEEKKEEKKDDIETNYIIDLENINKFKEYLLKQFEIFDDDYLYYTMNIPAKRFMPIPDPQSIFEFFANIMILTKMEKEVIIISLIYIERLIFNTGFIINSRNWRKTIFTSLIIASKIWDDDSLENIHYSQVFTHLKIGEINLLERTFLELINYKVFVKFSEYIKYYFAIKNLALRYNFNGEKIVPVSVEKMMKIQEYAFQKQKRMRKRVSLNNSAHF